MMTPAGRINRYKELKEMKEMRDLEKLKNSDGFIKGNGNLIRYNSNKSNRIKDKNYLTPINKFGNIKYDYGNK